MDIQLSDLATVGLLVLLEGLLSADNALVVAVMILGLPRREQKLALRYGLVGAFIFRIIATLLAIYLMRIAWVKLFGGLHLRPHEGALLQRRQRRAESGEKGAPVAGTVGAVGDRPEGRAHEPGLLGRLDSCGRGDVAEVLVILSGGLLGIVAMRIVRGQLLTLVRRYPSIVDGAFIIIAWIGFKLLLDASTRLA